MKLSYAISLHDTSHDLFARGDYREQISWLSRLGYQGVELGIKDPGKVRQSCPDLENILASSKMEVSAIGTGQSFIDEHLSLSSADPETRLLATNRLKDVIDFAENLHTNVIVGLIRGCAGGLRSLDDFLESMKLVCDHAAKKAVTVLLEPLNRNETNVLNTAAEATEFIKRIGSGNLRLLLDTFHMSIEEDDLPQVIMNARNFIGHIHLADDHRECPGEGNIDFLSVLSALKMVEYNKYLTCEIKSSFDFKTSSRNYFKFMTELKDRLENSFYTKKAKVL